MIRNHRANRFRVRKCRHCIKSFEISPAMGYSKPFLEYYFDFPTYGMKEDSCPICEGDAYKYKIIGDVYEPKR